MNLGFSTGCLYRLIPSIHETVEIYSSLEVGAELSFPTPFSLMNFKLDERFVDSLKKLRRVSVHAPWKGIEYGENDKTYYIFRELRKLSEKLWISGFVLHPDIVSDFSVLEKSGLYFLIENMDRRKCFGANEEDIEKLRADYDVGFVLDVQHAYEHDSSMRMAKSLMEIMGDRLREMHVSGSSNGRGHVMTHLADNRESISEILRLRKEVPIVLEGRFPGKIEEAVETAKKELRFIRSFYN